MQERRLWPRFGDAASEAATDSITARGNEDILFERVRAARATTEERRADDMKSVMQGSDKSAIVGSLKDLLYKRRMERQLAAARGLIAGPELPPSEDGPDGGLLPTAGAKGGYVPPSVRNRAAAGPGESMQRRDENSVRVTNLSEDTREEDLRELCAPFGQVSRVYIAYDRETGESRGFAFVNFVYRCVVAREGWGEARACFWCARRPSHPPSDSPAKMRSGPSTSSTALATTTSSCASSGRRPGRSRGRRAWAAAGRGRARGRRCSGTDGGAGRERRLFLGPVCNSSSATDHQNVGATPLTRRAAPCRRARGRARAARRRAPAAPASPRSTRPTL